MYQYPCFISFRHYGDCISESFINQFVECITAELLPLFDKKPFIDFARMGPGYSLSESISQALCKSACMIVIWTPHYFSADHIWCAKEFKAMERLEAERLLLLPLEERSKKLIIPVIYRGSKYYPNSLINTLYLNFEKFSLYESEMVRNRNFSDDIKKTAEYIKDRADAFTNLGLNPWDECGDLELPSDDDVKEFIIRVNNQKFPFRDNQ